ncbi:cinnamoyl-CoA reductase 1-like [Zingiber officinale]|uniref:cinnamoyl-CoA reductase 1-like n=1 Tax=Zingiber officinale TaxID=94328 RepID=UPI001C4C97A8|nr:cinnamoyl-CoA reductase 1-like [Zingiber officinale]
MCDCSSFLATTSLILSRPSNATSSLLTSPSLVSHSLLPFLLLVFWFLECLIKFFANTKLQPLPLYSVMAPAFVHRDRNAVCVMDASSRLGVSLVIRLLQRGYTVHAAGYSRGKHRATLERLSAENRRLRLFDADPFDYHSIVDAVRGCSGLFYAFDPPQEEPYDDLVVDVEVRAAHNAVEACAQVETMERVVFTSSVTAVVWQEHRELAVEFDEREWSEPSFCRKNKLWHAVAKTLAEKTAWALAMDRGVDMISINAGLVMVPELSANSSYLKGAMEMYHAGVLVTVDVDFLVDAHVAVYESAEAYGRYLCFNNVIRRPPDATKLAEMLSPDVVHPPACYELKVEEQHIQNKKLNKVLMDFDPGRQVDEQELNRLTMD